PRNVNDTPDAVLRACGLSGTKVQYVKNIAQAFLDGRLSDEMIMELGDDEIVDELVKIKGIGTWTAQMFLIFCLGREDVFSYGDLGLRRGVQWLCGLEQEPSEAFCEAVCARWSPHNTAASLYLWEITIRSSFAVPSSELLYESLEEEMMNTGYYDSPIGTLEIVTTDKGLEKMEFVQKQSGENGKDSPLMREVKAQLKQYFNGERRVFDLPLNLVGTPFQRTVWQALCTIPFGQTRSYGQLAATVGNAKASRAVGGANNRNKIAIVVPCHRVIGANGNLTGYAGGLDKKEWLLAHEAAKK
ncbi:MAG: methylated-DNA--[protein]-cysteine S-methyltransferase, partial [Clostridia bacterium]|nr:methylated-DNA--[protein]-cysteine S-methyltransferase [Clostridia bacterium]